MILERSIQQIRPGMWAELEKIDKKYNAVEKRLGFPAKKRYQCYFGGHTTDTLNVEREWESMAAMETAFTKAFGDPAWLALEGEAKPIIKSSQEELYLILS